MSIDITVLMPAYNHASYIEGAIASVLGQTCRERLRIVVSDDCSTDDTHRRAVALCRNERNVTVLQTPANLGVMPHYRWLAPHIDTPYVAILETDDLWINSQKLELQIAMLEQLDGVEGCFTAYRVADEKSGREWLAPSWARGRSMIVPFVDLLRDNPVATFSNCLYRRSAFVAGLERATTGYDWLVNLIVASQGGMALVGTPSTLYRVHERGTWSAATFQSKQAAIKETLEAIYQLVTGANRLVVADFLKRLAVP